MKLQKKHIITGIIAIGTISGAVLYWQYQKLMEYCISFNRAVLKKISLQNINIDLFLNIKNNSSLKIEILSQDYVAFINNVLVAKASNIIPQIIEPKATSQIAVNIDMSPQSVLKTLSNLSTDLMMSPSKVIVTVKINVKVKLWIFKISIPYEYKTSIKDLMSAKPQNASTSNEKKC